MTTMTGAEHYAEAERVLGEYARVLESVHEALTSGGLHDAAGIGAMSQACANALALAQVHATLALAAATAAESPLRAGDSLPSYGRTGVRR